MAGPISVQVRLDKSPSEAAFAEMESLVEFLNGRRQFGDSPLSLPQFPQEAFRLESDYLAAGAGECVVRLYPTDALLGFLAACRARYPEFMSVEES